MTNTYCNLLIAILIASSACLANAQSQSSVAIITGEIRNPTSREIAFSYQPPSALGSAEEHAVLDSLDRFACELPVIRGSLARAYCDDGRSIFFIEPGDSLHVVVEGGTYSFSGPNADNSRFMAELLPRLRGTRLDYENLKVEDFSRQADQWLQDQLEFLAEKREEYARSPSFIDYETTYFNYGWARLMISYPTEYRFANGHDNREITPEYYDFLKKIPLVNEKAIGVGNYRVFLDRTLGWELELDKTPRPHRLSEIYDLSSLELSEETEGPSSTPCTQRTDGPTCLKWLICQRLVCRQRPKPNWIPSTKRRDRSSSPRCSIYRNWVYQRLLKPSTTPSLKRVADRIASSLRARKRWLGWIRWVGRWFSTCL